MRVGLGARAAGRQFRQESVGPARQAACGIKCAVAPALARNKKIACRQDRGQSQPALPPSVQVLTSLISVDYLAAASLSLLLLPSPSRPSGCRPSFTDNPKAQPLFAQHSLLFTSLAGVTFFHFTFSAIRPFHITACPTLVVPSHSAEADNTTRSLKRSK
jgi:hypothetical protein